MELPLPAVFKLAISGIKEDSQLTLPLIYDIDEAKIEFSNFLSELDGFTTVV